MKTTINAILIFTLISCVQKAEKDVALSNNDSLEQVKLQKTAEANDAFVGEWVLQLSCDGSIVCNQCPMVLFRKDGSGVTNGNGLLIANCKWERKKDRLSIVNRSESVLDEGEYSFKFEKNGDTVRLKLIDIKNGNCFLLYRPLDNR